MLQAEKETICLDRRKSSMPGRQGEGVEGPAGTPYETWISERGLRVDTCSSRLGTAFTGRALQKGAYPYTYPLPAEKSRKRVCPLHDWPCTSTMLSMGTTALIVIRPLLGSSHPMAMRRGQTSPVPLRAVGRHLPEHPHVFAFR